MLHYGIMRKDIVQGAVVRRLQKDARGLLFLRLPRVLMEAMGWKPGDKVAITVKGRDKLVLQRIGSDRDR